ncbi:MAG: hypothetical protein K2G49_11615 [Muribaculum sp.]|nr:hypothetical protein [Muribaculum sp.]
MQCRGEWKLARVSTPWWYCCVAAWGNRCIVCVSGELPLAPTATRWGLRAVGLRVVLGCVVCP